MKKRWMALLLLCGVLAGCSAPKHPISDAQEGQEPETVEEDTGDASLDDPRNQDGIGDKEILVVSFGTSYNDNRRLTIGAVEQAIADAYPDYAVRRAFTSQIIIDHVKKRDGVEIDNVQQALERAADNGVKTLVVQPTHLMDGFEYQELEEELASYADAFEKVVIAKPLLSADEDFTIVAKAVAESAEEYDDKQTALCLMGHGTEAQSNRIYAQMQDKLEELGYDRCFVGTVEAEPTLEDVLAMVEEKGCRKIVLRPLMLVAGDHANNDMAGDDPASWKSVMEKEGYEVTAVVAGLGELPEVQQLYVSHLRTAMEENGL